MHSLLDLLADNKFHAGDELGQQLGISRAAVWKKIQKMQQMGIDIQSVKGKGYRLLHSIEWLDKDEIDRLMSPQARLLLAEIRIFQQLDSTNGWLLGQLHSGVSTGQVVLAEQQTQGRGRRGRQWVSPLGCNLYMSVLWRFSQGAAQLEGLSLAAGVAAIQALSGLGVAGIGLKWPNDLVTPEGAKFGGILLEMSGDPAGECQVVLGIGINHKMSIQAGGGIDQQWTTIDRLKEGVGRNELAASLISEWMAMLQCFSVQGFAPYREAWLKADAFAGQPVTVSSGNEVIEGVAMGVDGSGGLQLQTDAGVISLRGGELSLRLRT